MGALATAFYDHFDRLFLGWTQWAWSANYHETRADGFAGSDFSITDEFHNHRANYIIRPAPRAIAGQPVRFKVRPASLAGCMLSLAPCLSLSLSLLSLVSCPLLSHMHTHIHTTSHPECVSGWPCPSGVNRTVLPFSHTT